MHQDKLYYDKHCQISLGSYVQGLINPNITNTQSPIKIDIIYLEMNLNKQGGYVLIYLESVIPITRRKLTEIPVN